MPNSFCLPGGVLPWHHADPGREVASPVKGSPVADGGHGCGRDQRTEAGDLAQTPAECILVADPLHLIRDRFNVDLHLLPLLPHALQQPAQARAQILLGIFHHSGEVLAEVYGICREADAAFE